MQDLREDDFVSIFSRHNLDVTELRQAEYLYRRAIKRGVSYTHRPRDTQQRRAALIAGILDAVRKGRVGDRAWAKSMIGKKRVKYKIARDPHYYCVTLPRIGHEVKRAMGLEKKVCCTGPEWE